MVDIISSLIKKSLIFLIKGYKIAISPFVPCACRHTPSCSAYAIAALETFGIFKGGWMALKRILRCNPWGSFGFDPVNESAKGLKK